MYVLVYQDYDLLELVCCHQNLEVVEAAQNKMENDVVNYKKAMQKIKDLTKDLDFSQIPDDFWAQEGFRQEDITRLSEYSYGSFRIENVKELHSENRIGVGVINLRGIQK